MKTEVTKIIEFDMGHRVPNHKSQCRNLHGHRYRLEVTVTGDICKLDGDSSEGMILDFSDLKKVMTSVIHNELDHGCMWYKKDLKMKSFFESNPDMKNVSVDFIPTAENIAGYCAGLLQSYLPSFITLTKVRLYETPNSWADFTP